MMKHKLVMIDFTCRYPDIQTRVKKAKEELDFFYTIEHITYVRKMLGFPLLSKQVLDIIDMKTCACHAVIFSKSQGRIIYQYTEGGKGPGYTVRAANHPNRPPPFVKATTEHGYHTIEGSKCAQNQRAAHIRMNEILNYPMSWYLPPCQSVFMSSHFDYLAVNQNAQLFQKNKSVFMQYANKNSQPSSRSIDVDQDAEDMASSSQKGP